MTHSKAASLTSALLARKGDASPASLVIAELEEADSDEISIPGARARGRGNHSSQRQKANLPSPEMRLPLLDYVEAQIAADERARGEECVETEVVEEEPPLAGEVMVADVQHDPAASLLARAPLSPRLRHSSPHDDTRPLAKTLDATLRAQWAAAEALEAAAAEIGSDAPLQSLEQPEPPEKEAPQSVEPTAEPVAEDFATPEESVRAVDEAGGSQDHTEVEGPDSEPPSAAEASEEIALEPDNEAASAQPEARDVEVQVLEAQSLEAQLPHSATTPAADSPASDVRAADAPVAEMPASDPPAVDAEADDTPTADSQADAPATEDSPVADTDAPDAEAPEAQAAADEVPDDTAPKTAAADVPTVASPALEPPTAETLGPALYLPIAEEAKSPTIGSALPPASDDAGKDGLSVKGQGEGAMPSPQALADLQAREPVARTVGPRKSGRQSAWEGPSWRMAAVVLLGVGLGFAGYTLWAGQETSPTVQSAGSGTAPAESAAPLARDLPTATAGAPAEPAITKAAPASSDGDPGLVLGEPPVPLAAPVSPAAAIEDKPLETAAGGGTAAIEQATIPDPSFDIIRIEPNGQSIIAGRADPFSEWILLNNGEPIGSVRADANGEWVILPDASLVPGANDFSLVPKAERGKVAIPGRDRSSPGVEAENPATEAPLLPQSENRNPAKAAPVNSVPAGGDQEAIVQVGSVPLPHLKPAGLASLDTLTDSIRLAPAGVYAVQFASVRRSTAAEQERVRLIRAYPGLLGELDLRVQEASIEGAGIFYRLRSGPLEDLSQAREVCRQLELRGQGCLVVVRAVEAVQSLPEPKPLPPSQRALAPTQQAENPD